jgi:NAD(P)-dependent dehydrogenase (short-subunit alcohol dehydrogenase family)
MASINVDPAKLKSLAGKTVLITGGCSGIGLSTVELFHSLGCNVVVGDVQPPPENIAIFQSDRVTYCRADISSWSSIQAFFATAAKAQEIDIVVANAGLNEIGDQFFDTEVDQNGNLSEPDYRVIDVNLKGTANTMKLAFHHLRPKGGSIIITASLAGYQGSTGLPIYSSTKHGKIR